MVVVLVLFVVVPGVKLLLLAGLLHGFICGCLFVRVCRSSGRDFAQ